VANNPSPKNTLISLDRETPSVGSLASQRGPLPEYEEGPGFAATMGAAWERENTLSSQYAFGLHRPGPNTEEEDLSYLAGEMDTSPPEGMEDHADYFARYVTSERTRDWAIGNVIRERENERILSESPVIGFIGMAGAAMTSPEQWPSFLIPGALVLKGATLTGSRAAGAVAAEMGVAAASTAVSEAILHPTQATRTSEETAYAIGLSTVFAGLITGGIAAGRLGSGTVADFKTKLENDIFAADKAMDDVVDDLSKNIGAAETKGGVGEQYRMQLEDAEKALESAKLNKGAKKVGEAQKKVDDLRSFSADDMSKLKHPRLAKALMQFSPAMRVAQARVAGMRDLNAMLVDDTMLRVRHQFGDKLEASVESRMIQFETEMGKRVTDATNTGYASYAKAMKEAGNKPEPIGLFLQKVGKAMRNGDEYAADANVTSTAKALRSEVSDRIQGKLDTQDLLERDVVSYDALRSDMMAEYIDEDEIAKHFTVEGLPKANIDQLPSDVKRMLVTDGHLQTSIVVPAGDPSYLHRLWDFDKLKADEVGFKTRVAKHFEDGATKAEHAKTVGRVQTSIEGLEAEADKLRTKIAGSRVKKRNVVKRTYEERRAENAKLKADDPDAKLPTRNEPQKLWDMEQEIKHRRDVDLPRAEKIYASRQVEIRNEAKSAADELFSTIRGDEFRAAAGGIRTSYKVGPLKMRTLDIPSTVIDDYLENDVEKVMAHYVHGINAPLHMKEVFDPSSVDGIKFGKDPQTAGTEAFDHAMAKVKADYDRLKEAAYDAGDKKLALKIGKEWDAMKRDTGAMHDILAGKYKPPVEPGGILHKVRQRLMEFNVVTMLGMVTISSIPDIGNYIARRGMKSFARDLGRVAANLGGIRHAARTLEKMGMGADLFNAGRLEKLTGLADHTTPAGGTAGRAWENSRQVFSKASLMPMWNNAWKSMSAVSFTDDIIVDALRAQKGTLPADSVSKYAKAGLSPDDMKRIAKQINTKRDSHKGIWVPEVDEWADTEIAEMLKRVVRKETDMTIVSPGAGDLPLISKGEVGKMIFQFKSFAFAANNRILGAGLDNMTADRVAGLMTMIMLGYVSYYARESLKGKEPATDFDSIMREGFDRSGAFGVFTEINSLIAKMTAGELDAMRLIPGIDKGTYSRYASRNMLGALMGVSAGRVADVGQLSTAVATGDYRQSDMNAVRRMVYANNLWMTHYGFTKMTEAPGG